MKSLRFVVPILIGGLVFGSLPLAHAQNPFSTAAMQAWKQSITTNGYMGAPRYATAALPTCDANNVGALAFDTTATSLVVCNASAWAAAGGVTSPVAGDIVWTGKQTFGSAADAANSVRVGETAGAIVGEGATANDFETTLAFGDATADNTLSFTGTATGVTLTTTTGSTQVTDNDFLACDDGDFTKCAAFQVSGVSAGTTRTYTLPNASSTLCVAGVDCAFSVSQTFNGVPTIPAGIYVRFTATTNNDLGAHTTLTPDALALRLGTTANAWHVYEAADLAYDFNNGPCGTAACINPQTIVHDKDQNTTNYQSLGVSGLSGSFRVTLTETTATAIVQIPIVAEASVSGELLYTVHATDGSTPQTRSGRVIFNVNNDGGTETCVLGTPEELDNTPTGTLTATITCATSPTNAVNIEIDATSSLSQTTLEAYGTVILVGSGEPLPQ